MTRTRRRRRRKSHLVFESVVSASQRRVLFKVRVVETKKCLVLKFAKDLVSGDLERQRVERAVALFSSKLQSHRQRVRFPIGTLGTIHSIIVSEWWDGRSLHGAWVKRADFAKVRKLLTTRSGRCSTR